MNRVVPMSLRVETWERRYLFVGMAAAGIGLLSADDRAADTDTVLLRNGDLTLSDSHDNRPRQEAPSRTTRGWA